MKDNILAPSQEGSLLERLNSHTEGTLMGNLGLEYTKVTEEVIEATMPVDERTRQPFGILHGGATLALAETIAGLGSNLICAEDELSVGMQVSGNHISSARDGDSVRAVGHLIHRGRRTHIWEVEVVSEATGRLISSVRVTNSIILKETR